MKDEFTENLGKYPYLSLREVKDYLGIKSDNQDARLTEIIRYATGAVEHYIGQEVLANTYTEVFIDKENSRTALDLGVVLDRDLPVNRLNSSGRGNFGTRFNVIRNGTQSAISKFVKRIPLKEIYEIRTIDDKGEVIIYNDSTIQGSYVKSNNQSSFSFSTTKGSITDKIKRFGKSCAKNILTKSSNNSALMFEEGNFTIEAQVRLDSDGKENEKSNTSIITLSDENYTKQLSIGATLEDGIYIAESTHGSDTITIPISSNHISSYTLVSATNNKFTIDVNSSTLLPPQKRKWSHLAITRNLEKEEMYIHYDGKLMNRKNVSITVPFDNLSSSYTNYMNNSLTYGLDKVSNVASGTFHPAIADHNYKNIDIGHCSSRRIYIDEVRISDTDRYSWKDFDAPVERFRPDNDTALLVHFDSNTVLDSSKLQSSYTFSKDMGQVIFANPPNSDGYMEIRYRAGYEMDEVPEDLKLATLDYIKMVHKNDQDAQRAQLDDDSHSGFRLVRNFPPHIVRILDFYRIGKFSG